MSDPAAAIEVCGLSKFFCGRAVLRGIDLEILSGESVALTGANGAGKTTLLRCLATLLRPTEGEVRWFGRPARGNPAQRRLVGMVAHDSLLYPHLTARENLVFAARMYDVPEPKRKADASIRSVGLELHADRPCAKLSKGMRQRLAVLRATVHEPSILLLDEPFSGLDVEGAEWLLWHLRELRDGGTTLCFTTHDPAMVERLAVRVLHLSDGRLQEHEQAGRISGEYPKARAA